MSSQAPPALRRANPRLGEAQAKGMVAPVARHLIGNRCGQDRSVRHDGHLNVIEALRAPSQVAAGIAGDVRLVAEHLAPDSGE